MLPYQENKIYNNKNDIIFEWINKYSTLTVQRKQAADHHLNKLKGQLFGQESTKETTNRRKKKKQKVLCFSGPPN